ncbi:MAG TPA: tetratricopeptide repeat protein, partial [Chloroflexota bacterium]|nr:tetratricopeptide repeat protein [Chloroflexota bacterium]
AAYDAVRLFVERARASRRDFALTGENASALVSLCRRLDGLPLALELAAARVRVLSVEQLAARLDDRFRLLTRGSRTAPPRQQTLLATVAWSYDLLPPAERRLFARLAVFAGDWTLEGAEAICADPTPSGVVPQALGEARPGTQGAPGEGLDPDDVLDLLSQLVDKSLVLVDEADGGGEVRYRLLESLREFAAERLAEEGEGAGSAVRRRHAAFYLALAEQAAGGLDGAAQAHWLARLEAEHDNLRQALRWAVETGQTELGLRLGVSLWRFWNAHAYLSEGREWLGRVLDLPGGEASPALAGLRGRALTAAGTLAWAQGDYGAARARHQAALQALRALGDQRGAAMALFGLGQVTRLTGDEREAHDLYQRSLAIFQGLHDRWGESVVLRDLGHVAGDVGDHQGARRYYARSLALAQELGDRSGTASAMMYLGLQAYHQEHYDVARSSYEAALAIWRELGNRRSTAESLRLLGLVAESLGDTHQATALHTESLALRREAGDRYGVAECLLSLADPARERGELDRAGALLRESLTLCRELDSKRMMAVCLLKLADVLAAAGEPVRAARLLGAGETELATLGAGIWPADRAVAEATAGALAGALGQEALERARGEGQAMALQEAVAYALAP